MLFANTSTFRVWACCRSRFTAEQTVELIYFRSPAEVDLIWKIDEVSEENVVVITMWQPRQDGSTKFQKDDSRSPQDMLFPILEMINMETAGKARRRQTCRKHVRQLCWNKNKVASTEWMQNVCLHRKKGKTLIFTQILMKEKIDLAFKIKWNCFILDLQWGWVIFEGRVQNVKTTGGLNSHSQQLTVIFLIITQRAFQHRFNFSQVWFRIPSCRSIFSWYICLFLCVLTI